MNNTTLIRLSRLLSCLVHPIIIPAVAAALLLFGRTVMAPVPGNVKWLFMGMAALTTVILPGGLIVLLSFYKILPTFPTRARRVVLLVLAAFGFMACSYMLRDFMLAYLIRKYLLAALCCTVLTSAITLFWNVSLYMMALGSLVTVLTIMNYSGFGQFSWAVVILLAVTGLTASARLCLGKHNPAQIYTGFLCGAASAVAGMLLL